jgi:hypothetical protein
VPAAARASPKLLDRIARNAAAGAPGTMLAKTLIMPGRKHVFLV